MTNVHGISVSGGSFPAEIWRRFMEPALAGAPSRGFRSPARPVSFVDWQRGPLSLSYDPYYVAPSRAPAEDEEPEEKPAADDRPSTSAADQKNP